jgi:type IV pilus assembly protein PilW
MMDEKRVSHLKHPPLGSVCRIGTQGFSLVEFVISSLILLVVALAVFSALAETQRSASYQTEVQAVLDNTRLALDSVIRQLRQAGNDPRHTGFDGITVASSTEVRVRSDLTGSAAATGDPDKGDPDGDTSDSGEDITIRYNASGQSLEFVPASGTAQAIADHISAFSMQYFDAAGAATATGSDVRRIAILITGRGSLPDPRTRRVFSMRLASEVQLATRQ